MPGRTELERWLKLQIIDEKFFIDRMLALGYRKPDILNYLTEISIEIDTSKKKYLPIKTYQRWLASKILDEEEFTIIARDMKIREEDILRFIIEVRGAENEGA